MKILMFALAIIFLAGCAKEDGLCTGPIAPKDSRADILVIGDSISIGTTPFVRDALADKYNVVHNPCNGQDTPNGVRHIHYWLGLRPHWDAVVFNHGAWDVSKGRGVSVGDYRYNIRVEAQAILQHADHPLFVLTTQVPAHDTTRMVGDEVIYNQAAVEVMNELGIPVVDNYTLSTTIANLHATPECDCNVHWTDAGSQILANNILTSLATLGITP